METGRVRGSQAFRWGGPGDFTVGDFLVKPLEGLMESSGGKLRRLEPKTIGVLTCLAGLPGRTVSKEALLDAVWPDVEVTQHVLTRCVGQLRRAFGDDGRKQSVIQTVYKRGYRLLPPVRFRDESSPQARRAGGLPVSELVADELPGSLGYHQILSAPQDHIYLYDRDCRYLFANPAGARALGLKAADMVGKDWRELGLVAEILEPFEAQVQRCFTEGKAFLERVRYPTVYGDRFFEYSLDLVRDDSGAAAAVLAVVRDITDRCQNCPLRGDRGEG